MTTNPTSSALRPTNEQEIISIVNAARANNNSVHCYSAGFNWGYGINSAVHSDAISMDLSQMNKILSFDSNLGILKIQPGVTQGQLEEFLNKNNYNYYVPNTGAGSRGSLLGNALERGFGISPHHDHASAILSVRGILGDGSIYESALKEVDHKLADCFTWGVGPQLDKMVSQSSWIIVTEVSLQLKKRHPCSDIMVVAFPDNELKAVFNALRDLLAEDDGHVGSIKIFNKNQVLQNQSNQTAMKKMMPLNSEWFLTVIIYSNSFTRKSVLKYIKSHFSSYISSSKLYFNEKKVSLLLNILGKLPVTSLKEQIQKLKDMNQMIRLGKGYTSEVGYKALDINYDYESKELFDMSQLKTDLVWLSPICPLDPEKAAHLIEVIKKINKTHPDFKFNTFTWTVLNQRTLALVIPILFDKNDHEKFFVWYKKIHLELKKEGYIPYRFHTKMMDTLREDLLPRYFKHVEKFSKAMDPQDIIERGRY